MNNLVYDIGMHIGQDTRHYLNKGYNVLAIEANPVLVEAAKIKFKKEIASGRLTILNVGIAETEGVLPFYKNSKYSEWGSFDKELGSRGDTTSEVIDVPCISTKKLLETYGVPYYMKIDIEGLDHLCLSDISASGERPKYVSFEAWSIDWLDIIAKKGYTKFKLINQGDDYNPIDLNKEKSKFYPKYQTIKNGIKLRLQNFIPFKHMVGSSGPFGENSKGEWKSYDEIKKLYQEFCSEAFTKAHTPVSWFDFHASL